MTNRNISHRNSDRYISAFTLIELLVVVAIIALLISILIPSLSRARQNSQQTVCLSHLRSIGQTIACYAGENQNTLPYSEWNGMVPPTTGGWDNNRACNWYILLGNMLNIKTAMSYDTAGQERDKRTVGIFLCPAAANYNTTAPFGQYSAHPRLMPYLVWADQYARYTSPGSNAFMQPYKLQRIERASEIALIFDGSLEPYGDAWVAQHAAENLDMNHLNAGPGFGSFLTDQVIPGMPSYINPQNSIDMTARGTMNDGDVNKDVWGNWGNIRFRHMGDTAAAALMVDGHCEVFKFKNKYVTTMLRGNINVNP